MIVTICGAYRNCGDHLIGARARALLSAFVDDDIEIVDRREINDAAYDLMNKARAVTLCGGPAYQKNIYPGVYPLDRARVTQPIVPYGLGWKASTNQAPTEFSFSPEASAFVQDVHSQIEVSSARDPLTVEMLAGQGVANVIMTGCPAWYDLDFLETPYKFQAEPARIVLSMPAILQPGTFELMVWLSKRFPRAKRYLAFHHGIVPAKNKTGYRRARRHLRFMASAALRGWRSVSLAANLSKMEDLYTSADLHVGFRVHGHLLSLSRRRASILINEDSRGAGQAKALGAENLIVGDTDITPWTSAVENHIETKGAGMESAIETIRSTLPEMQRFLATL